MNLIRISLYWLLEIISLIVLIRCILSWFPFGYNKFTVFLYNITEPILEPVRKLLNKYMGQGAMYVDFSPIVVFLLITLLQRIVV